MRKSEFPRIKKVSQASQESAEENAEAPGVAAQRNWPVKLLIVSIAVLVFQFILFVKTYTMHQELAMSMGRATLQSGGVTHSQKSRELINNIEEMNSSEKPPKPEILKEQVIADFNKSGLMTSFNTRVYASKVGGSTSILELKLDSAVRFGSQGSSLLIAYDFRKQSAATIAEINIDLPVIDIARFQKLTFRTIATDASGRKGGERFTVHAISTSGDLIERDVENLYAFWKKYEINLWQGGRPPREFLLKQIKIIISRNESNLSSSFHLDDMFLE